MCHRLKNKSMAVSLNEEQKQGIWKQVSEEFLA
jgi:hypothetical protein